MIQEASNAAPLNPEDAVRQVSRDIQGLAEYAANSLGEHLPNHGTQAVGGDENLSSEVFLVPNDPDCEFFYQNPHTGTTPEYIGVSFVLTKHSVKPIKPRLGNRAMRFLHIGHTDSGADAVRPVEYTGITAIVHELGNNQKDNQEVMYYTLSIGSLGVSRHTEEMEKEVREKMIPVSQLLTSVEAVL